MGTSNIKSFHFNEKNIGANEIFDFVSFYKEQLKKSDKKKIDLTFEFGALVESVDELLYSYILLFIHDFPNTNINLDFVNNKPYHIGIQQVGYVNLYKKPETIIQITQEGLLSPTYTTASKDFFPFLLINQKTCGLSDNKHELFLSRSYKDEFEIFLKELDKSQIKYLKENINSKETFLKQLKKYKVDKPKDISDLSWHYILNSLSHLNVLRLLFDDIIKNKYQIRNLTLERSEKLAISIRETLKEKDFFKFSYIKVFVFNILVINQDNLKIDEKEKGDDTFIKEYNTRLTHLLNETDSIVTGLRELSKNIVEHSGKQGENSGFGVISARIHQRDKLEILKDDTLKEWCKGYKNKENESSLFLDINVIDSGFENVTTKYKRNIQNEIQKYSKKNSEKSYKLLKENLEKDLIKINSEKYTFSRFLNYKKIELQHQIYRANARLGLLIFSNLVIDKKGGIIKISSTDINSDESENAYLYTKANDLIVDNEIKANRTNNLGTNYNFIIPIELNDNFIEETTSKPGTGTPTSTLKTLFNYEIINYNSQKNDGDKTYIIQNIPTGEQVEKYEKIYAFSKSIIDAAKSKCNNSIILINAKEVSNTLTDSSDWIRLLASVQLSNNIPLIIYNIDFIIHQEIIAINKLYDAGGRFWNNKVSTLFYLKLEKPFEYKYRVKINNETQKLNLWFCDVLYGEKYNEYLSLNSSISNYQHNIYSVTNHNTELSNKDILIKNSSLFSKDGKLLNFELFIKSNDDLTLFEESVLSLLNLDVCTLPDNVFFKDNISKKEKFFYRFKGYKVSNSHFKLGSKIHISDFYYAKRLFHNSFFANRFAFLVAKYILENHLLGINKNEEVFLIGYSHYSELLVSNTRRLLAEKGFLNIKHDVILENKKVLKNASKISKRIIIIIPISSTFSTSDKIKKWLNDILKDNSKESINETWADINVLLVANKDFENFQNNSQLYNEFGWANWKDNNFETKILEKKISGSSDKTCTQKYFIPLTTDWYSIHNCKLCFPDKEKKEQEKCLLETGVNSIRPESIFSLPIARKKGNNNNITFDNYIDKKPLVIQKHIKRGSKHYKQYIRTGAFLKKKKNKEGVEDWLKTIKIEGADSVIIITPSSTANSGFVNMVNEFVFSETATVLQYSNKDDILQNFISFNYSLFDNSTVVFVDDALHTAESFHLINDYIKSIPCTISRYKKIDYCFCLFNRLGYFDEMNVLNSLPKEDNNSEKIFSFVELDVPPIKQPNYIFPDIIKGELFDGLAHNSVMDMMKIHFSELRENVKAYDLDINSKEPESEYTHLFNFIIYKAIFSYFSGEFTNGAEFNYEKDKVKLFATDDNEELLKTILSFIEKNDDVKAFLNSENGVGFKNEVETRVIYIFSTPPFSYYKDIKESAFKWLEKKILDFQDIIIEEKGNTRFFKDFYHCKKDNLPTTYSEYQTFKLYLRLAIELKSNYVFSIKMLNAIQILLNYLGKKPTTYYYSYSIDYKSRNSLFSDYDLIEKRGKEVSPIGLITYYTGLIQQLIYKEEAKATELIKNIVTIIKKVEVVEQKKTLTLKNDFNNHFMNLLRILVLENTFIFDTFHKTFQEELKELEYFIFENESADNYKTFQETLYEYKENKGQASRFKALDKMLIRHDIQNDSEDKDPDLEEAFQKTLYLKTLLRNEIDRKNNGGKIQIKVKSILKILCEILDINEDSKCNGGAFFTVRYKNLNKDEKEISSKDLYTIANYATTEEDRILANVTSDKSLIFEFFKGIKELGSKKPKSTLELLYDNNKKQYSSSKIVKHIDNTVIDINKNFIETSKEQHYNNLFFLRVSSIEDVEVDKNTTVFRSNPQAVLCFYKCNIKNIDNCDFKDSSFCNICDNNERLDPKRIRFLLLLRDDIKGFINYHLANDSLRAFVEQKEVLKIEEESKLRYEKAFHNFDHGVVSKVISQWAFIEKNYTLQKDKGLYTSAYRIGANIINSHFYAFLSKNMKINSLADDKVCNNSVQLIPKYFKEILDSIINSDLHIDDYQILLSEKYDINIEKFALRAFIILLLQNIKKHTETVLCTSVKIELGNTELTIVNSYKDNYSESYLSDFKNKERNISDNKINELEGTTLITIRNYCKERNVRFNFNLDSKVKKFSIKIKNNEKK